MKGGVVVRNRSEPGVIQLPAPQLPKRGPDDEKIGTSFRIPRGLKRELDEIADERGIDLSEVAVEFLKWALDEWRRENPKRAALASKK
jgi:hypothetical protein